MFVRVGGVHGPGVGALVQGGRSGSFCSVHGQASVTPFVSAIGSPPLPCNVRVADTRTQTRFAPREASTKKKKNATRLGLGLEKTLRKLQLPAERRAHVGCDWRVNLVQCSASGGVGNEKRQRGGARLASTTCGRSRRDRILLPPLLSCTTFSYACATAHRLSGTARAFGCADE